MRNLTRWQKWGLAAVAVLAIGALGYGVNRQGDDSAMFGFTSGSEGLSRAGVATDEAVAPSAMEDSESRAAPPGSAFGGEAPSLRQGDGASPDVGFAGGALVSSLDRKIAQTASLQLQVDEVGAGFEEVGRIATAAGGFVSSSSFSYQGERQVASVTVRVPVERYQSVLADLRGLGVRVDSENSEAQDVTEEYTDLSSRLRNLEATETQLLTLLGQADTVNDILTVQDRLNQVRYEIEQVKGRIQMLENMTSLATVTVHLRPATGDANTFNQSGTGIDLRAEVSEAWNASLEFLGGIAAGVISVVVFAWWVPLVALPLYLILRAIARNRPSPAPVIENRPQPADGLD